MRSKFRIQRYQQMNEINVVPYIDVMLVLLVIFMVTAPLLTEGVNVELPQAPAKPIVTEESIPFIVHVTADGEYYVNQETNEPVTLRQIQLKSAAVLRVNPATAFMVRGDRNVPFDTVVKAMVALQAAGIHNVSIVTRNVEINQ